MSTTPIGALSLTLTDGTVVTADMANIKAVAPVQPPPPPPTPATVALTASSLSIQAGGSCTLTVVAANASLLTLTSTQGDVYPLIPMGGTVKVQPPVTTTYTAVATSTDGTTVTSQLTVTVTPAPPTATIKASPSSIQVGSSSTLTITATNAATVTLTGSDGSTTPLPKVGGTLQVSPTSNVTYTATVVGTNGATTSAQTTLTVNPAPQLTEPVIPGTAKVFNMLPNTVPWKMNHDAGTSGDSTTTFGTTTYPVPAPNGMPSRLFDFTTAKGGGEIYHVNVTTDSSMFNTFCLEAEEWATNWTGVKCAEKDMEHADATGAYEDLATQIDGYSGTLDITANHGWVHLSIRMDPRQRDPNVAHPTRIYTRDNGDQTITYIGMFIDGTYYPINKTVNSMGSTKWNPKVLNLQIQYDGDSGSIETKVYMTKLNVYAWKS